MTTEKMDRKTTSVVEATLLQHEANKTINMLGDDDNFFFSFILFCS